MILCDRYGILVWQDFIFSCSVYPLDDAGFLENVKAEVEENVSPAPPASLALWCGNNEMEWGGWIGLGSARIGRKAAYDRFFHHTLPAWCAVEDSDTALLAQLAVVRRAVEAPNGQRQGTPTIGTYGTPPAIYRLPRPVPAFHERIRLQALPPLPTIATYAGQADWNMTSYVMEQHQRTPAATA